MKENGELETSVHEKITNCIQYIEFSLCHPLSCKQGIPYSQAKRYRRITSDESHFENDLSRLKEYFLACNYPEYVIEEAVKKVSSMRIPRSVRIFYHSFCMHLQSVIAKHRKYHKSVFESLKILLK